MTKEPNAELAPLVARVAELEADRDAARNAHARAIVQLSEWMERAEGAETALARVEALADDFDTAIGFRGAATALRAALAAAGPAVSDGEGATSEARQSRHYALEVRNAGGEVVETICPGCSDEVSEHWDNEDGSVVIGAGVPWSQCPASPVVAPSATDEDRLCFCGHLEEFHTGGFDCQRGDPGAGWECECTTFVHAPTPDAVPSGEATDDTTPTKEA